MEYKKYWSIADLGANSLKSHEVFLFLAILFLIAFIAIKKFKKSDRDYEKRILLWFTGVLSVMTFCGFIYIKLFTVDTTKQRVEAILTSDNVAVVEGIMRNFKSERPISKRGIVTVESFIVDSVNFSYSDVLLGRFNSFSKTNNGVFTNGLPVKITYDKATHDILMVEIGKTK